MIILRAVLGVVVVAFTRSAFIPVCFPEADTRIVHGRAPGIILLCFDSVIMGGSVVRAWAALRCEGVRKRESRGLVALVAAAMGWALAAGPYQLRAGGVFVRLIPSVLMLSVLLGESVATPVSSEVC